MKERVLRREESMSVDNKEAIESEKRASEKYDKARSTLFTA